MSDKRYTAQGMRDTAQCLHYNHPCALNSEAAAMLRQAADTEEELAKLKARLEAVVKECETAYDMICDSCPCTHCDLTCGQVEEIVNKRQKDILRVARGEGGAK